VRIDCPMCGLRDRREFYYKGAALVRPEADAGAQAWDDYVHLRENVAGRTRDLWQHEAGCGAWLVVTRNTATHEVYGVQLAAEFSKGESA
jgi:heterotetrameric sarcosine oxidase delta subunit